MTPAGIAKVEAAKLDGSWSAYDYVELKIVPPDLTEAMESSSGAKDAFFRLTSSRRKQFLYWITDTKRPETMAKRIGEVVVMSLEEDRKRRNR